MVHSATLLLTRPHDASRRFAQQVVERFGDLPIVISPLIEIAFLKIESTQNSDTVVFTSSNGVEAWANSNQPNTMRCFCVGEATGKAARVLGFDPHISGGTVEHLIEDIRKAGPEGAILHVHGRHTRGDLVENLRAGGLYAQNLIAYEQRLIELAPEARSLLKGGDRVIVPLFSPRSAAHFQSSGPFGPQVCKIAISESAAKACQGAYVAPIPNAEGMLSAISKSLIA